MSDMKQQDELDPQLQAKLKPLLKTHPRDAASANLGRTRFLAEAHGLAVTIPGQKRLTEWKDKFKYLFRRKENAPMFSTLISAFLILATLLGGSGITVAAAQTSQPGSVLYPVKILSEDAYYQLTAGDQNHFDLAMDYAERRMAEFQNMLENGQIPPEAIQARLQTHLQTALELSIKDPADQERLLEQIRQRLQEQLQTKLQQTIPDPAGEALRLQVRDMLQTQIGWADDALEQLTQLRLQTQNQQQIQTAQPEEAQGSSNNGSQSGQPQVNQYGNSELTPTLLATATPTGTQYQYQNGSGNEGSSGSGQGGSGSGQGK